MTDTTAAASSHGCCVIGGVVVGSGEAGESQLGGAGRVVQLLLSARSPGALYY